MTDSQMPLFEGRQPDKTAIKLSGSVEFARELASAHHLQQSVFVVVETTVGAITHQVDSDGDLHRVHALKAESLAVLPAGEGAKLLIEQHRKAREAAGIHELPLAGDDGDSDDGEPTGEWEMPAQALQSVSD